jgi:hypothetical protein
MSPETLPVYTTLSDKKALRDSSDPFRGGDEKNLFFIRECNSSCPTVCAFFMDTPLAKCSRNGEELQKLEACLCSVINC